MDDRADPGDEVQCGPVRQDGALISPSDARRTRAWLARHRRDAHVRAAKAHGWRSRAAAKLIALDDRHGLLRGSLAVLDLGAAPGGWCQVARSRADRKAAIVGIDLLRIEPLEGVSLLEGDFTDPAVIDRARALLPDAAPLVLSDAAPDLSGIRDRDDAACERLHEAVFTAADELDACAVALKTFSGAPFELARSLARDRFDAVSVQRPSATRKHSSESYIIAKGRKG